MRYILAFGRSVYKLEIYLSGKSYFNLFCTLLAVKLLFSVTSSFIVTFIDANLLQGWQENQISVWETTILSLIIAPFFETMLFQFGIIEVGKSLKVKDALLILISSFSFGLSHFYNWAYFSIELVVGFIYAYSYLITKNRFDSFKSFTLVLFLHFISNLVALLNNQVFKFF